MTPDEVLKYCLETLEWTVLVDSWGEQGVFYNPDGKLKRGIYILTVKEKDGANDKSSKLDRKDVYRVNLGIRRNSFSKIFGAIPARPAKGCVVNMDYDFSSINTLLPHPVYAWMGWICILNPSKECFDELKPLIQEAYACAKEKYKRRKI